MIHQLTVDVAKLGAATFTGLLGVTIAGEIEQQSWVVGLERMGSFALVAVFVIGTLWLIGKTLPILLQMFERTKDQFVAELQAERAAREKSVEAFREMLQSHRTETVNAIREQTALISKVIEATNPKQ